jgi:short-subunit dehydrogenase
MSRTLTNQVAVITGASSGIGWALALELTRAGCKVGLIARRQDKLTALAEEIRKAGGKAASAPADVGNREQVRAAIEVVRASLGPIDLLIANAGVGKPTFLNPVNMADVEEMFRVNLMGVIYAIEAVLPEMLSRRQGHIAAVSSLAAYKGLPAESAYCASKAAVNLYLEGLRIQLRSHGIAVTTICPGFVKTPMTEINQFAMPLLMDADTAARRIVAALRRRTKVYDFPWPMKVLCKWLLPLMPDWVVARGMAEYVEKPPVVPEASGGRAPPVD